MKSVQRLFADMTATVENLHNLAVEGQRRDNSLDMLNALAAHARDHVVAIDSIAVAIKARLESRA